MVVDWTAPVSSFSRNVTPYWLWMYETSDSPLLPTIKALCVIESTINPKAKPFASFTPSGDEYEGKSQENVRVAALASTGMLEANNMNANNDNGFISTSIHDRSVWNVFVQ